MVELPAYARTGNLQALGRQKATPSPQETKPDKQEVIAMPVRVRIDNRWAPQNKIYKSKYKSSLLYIEWNNYKKAVQTGKSLHGPLKF